MRIPFLAGALFVFSCGESPAANWPAWRGPHGNGISSESGFPLRWSPTNNIRWRVDLPDRGNSTPIVWGDRVFLTQAIDASHRRLVLAFHRADGRLLWEGGTTWDTPEETHEDNPYCAGSPVTDGERVVASFGSAGVWAFDFAGRVLWKQDLGAQKHEWGQGPSPILYRDQVFVFHGPGKESKLVALRAKDGSLLWQKALPEPTPQERTDGFKGRGPGIVGNFGTPLMVKAGEREELILGLPDGLRALSPDSGSELWSARGLNPLIYSSPLPVGDRVLIMGGYFGSSLSIRIGGAGDVTETHRLWREERSKKNRLGSPVVKDGHVFMVNMDGFLECLDLATGRQLWEERLDGPGAADASWSSLTLTGDRLYAVNKSGDSFVIRASPRFEVLAINTVGEPSNSSLAMSDGELFLRTWKGLWCIRDKERL